MDIKATKLEDLLREYNEAFQKRSNRLMDCHKILNREQKDDEILSSLAGCCHFGTKTTGLIYDIFVSNMKNAVVHETCHRTKR